MYADIRPDSLARVIVGFLPIFDYNAEAAIREAFDPEFLDPGIVFSTSYLDDIAIACFELFPMGGKTPFPTLLEWRDALYKVNQERKAGVPAIAAQAAIPKWAVGVIVFLGGLFLLSKKRG
jgi:hypothetical protein